MTAKLSTQNKWGMNKVICSKDLAEHMMNKNRGTLDISDTWITQLPEELTVNGDLILNRYIKKLPNKLVVLGNLDLRDTQVDLQDTSQLYVEGNLYTGPQTTGFKWCVEVEGDLDLRASKNLMRLDNGVLIVYGSLYLGEDNKLITEMRQSIGIEGDMILKGSCIERFSYGRVVSAKNIDLSYSMIRTLPDDFVVYGDLNVSFTSLIEYPERMVVFGNLDIRGTKLPIRQKGVAVFGDTFTDSGVVHSIHDNQLFLENV